MAFLVRVSVPRPPFVHKQIGVWLNLQMAKDLLFQRNYNWVNPTLSYKLEYKAQNTDLLYQVALETWCLACQSPVWQQCKGYLDIYML